MMSGRPRRRRTCRRRRERGRAARAPPACLAAPDSRAQGIRRSRASSSELSGGGRRGARGHGRRVCSKCGRRAEPGDVYCASRGAALPELASAPGRASWRQRLAGLIGQSRRERVVTAVTLVVVAAAVAAAIVLLTGSDDDGSTYVGLADQACVAAEGGIAQVHDKVARGERDPAEALALESAPVAELAADWRSRVSRLDPPPDLAQRAAAIAGAPDSGQL